MTIYDRAAATARRLLAKYGQTVTLRRITTGAYDPSTGSASQTTTDYTGNGAVFDFEQRVIDGTSIKVGDQQLLLSPFQTNGDAMPEPSTSDQIVIGTTVHSIQPSGKIAPAGTDVLFQLHIRGL